MQAPFRRLAPAALLGFALVACSGSSAPAPSSGEPSAQRGSSSQFPGAADCEPIDLRDPSGERIDLTGTWEGGPFTHHVRQINSCVWWIGYARWPGLEPGELATLAFFGRLADDFTLTGRWALLVSPAGTDRYFPGPADDVVTFDVEFGGDGGPPTLEARWEGHQGPEGVTYPSESLSWLGPIPPSANPPQQ